MNIESLEVFGSANQAVRNIMQWQDFSLPSNRAYHWKPGRSACELGRAWSTLTEIRVPLSVRELLQSNPDTRGTKLTKAFIEYETPLPYGTRGPRCHDLLVLGDDSSGAPVILSVEAKADEPFDSTLSQKIATIFNPKSKVPERIEWLSQYLFGTSAFENLPDRRLLPFFGGFGYQLFSSLGGLCVEAELRKASKAIMLFHTFRTSLTNDRKIAANAAALSTFIRAFGLANSRRTRTTGLQGPFRMRSGSFDGKPFPGAINLYIGEIKDDLLERMDEC